MIVTSIAEIFEKGWTRKLVGMKVDLRGFEKIRHNYLCKQSNDWVVVIVRRPRFGRRGFRCHSRVLFNRVLLAVGEILCNVHCKHMKLDFLCTANVRTDHCFITRIHPKKFDFQLACFLLSTLSGYPVP